MPPSRPPRWTSSAASLGFEHSWKLSRYQAFFSWLAQPVVARGVPKLVPHDQANCAPLTDELLGRVVEQVVAWYDAVETVLIA